jgi:hypothetical protein
MSEKWYIRVWKNIEEYIYKIDDKTFDSNSIFNFLDKIEKNISCKKCKIHFHNFKKPSKFLNKEHVIIWFNKLKLDIKNNKKKISKDVIVTNNYNNINNRIKKKYNKN